MATNIAEATIWVISVIPDTGFEPTMAIALAANSSEQEGYDGHYYPRHECLPESAYDTDPEEHQHRNKRK